MPSHPIVLASASPARLRLLRDAGLDPAVVVSGVDETSVSPGTAAQQAEALAVLKATSVAGRHPQAVVIGCDSLLAFAGEVYGKPANPVEALSRWRAFRGREGSLVTGHCVVVAGRVESAVAATAVRFGHPTDEELHSYVASGEPLAVAGGFTLDGRSAPFLDGIDGDAGNVIGLSLPLLRSLLLRFDIGITQLWR